MNYQFENIVIIGHRKISKASDIVMSLIQYMQMHKITIFLEQETSKILSRCSLPSIQKEEFKNYCDLIVVVGGDGSLLSASRIAAQQELPIIGINLGELGFLTDITPNNIKKIDQIFLGEYHEERRFLLTSSGTNTKHNHDDQYLALNDIVISSTTTGRMIDFAVYIDQKFLCNYRSDGLIIATPTGSTAHALSSGGPILYPTLQNIVLVPILSHNLSSRPIVISNNSIITIKFNKSITDNILTIYDGQIRHNILNNIIKIKKTKKELLLLHPKDYNYFETLRTKLNWEKFDKI